MENSVKYGPKCSVYKGDEEGEFAEYTTSELGR